MFNFMDDILKKVFPNNNILSLKVSTEVDMSACWKGLGRGGAMKQKEYPCHCCGVTSNSLYCPNPLKCGCYTYAEKMDDPNWFCYHHPIITNNILSKMKKDVVKLKSSIISYFDRIKESRMSNKDPLSNNGCGTLKTNPY